MIEDTRRAPRRSASDNIPVIDQIREHSIGRLGNLSETGLLMLSNASLVDDALYQISFELPIPGSHSARLDIGAHMLWQEPAQAPGQSWAGFRFLTISDEHRHLLRQWVAAG